MNTTLKTLTYVYPIEKPNLDDLQFSIYKIFINDYVKEVENHIININRVQNLYGKNNTRSKRKIRRKIKRKKDNRCNELLFFDTYGTNKIFKFLSFENKNIKIFVDENEKWYYYFLEIIKSIIIKNKNNSNINDFQLNKDENDFYFNLLKQPFVEKIINLDVLIHYFKNINDINDINEKQIENQYDEKRKKLILLTIKLIKKIIYFYYNK